MRLAEDTTDEQGVPVIVRTQRKIDTLKRRCSYLEEQLETTTGPQAAFMRSEVSALKSAVVVLRYHRATVVEDLETPIDALAELVREAEIVVAQDELCAAFEMTVAKAKGVLEEWA